MDDSIIIAIVSFILGGISSFLISRYFYNKSKLKISKDLVRKIIMKSQKEDYSYNNTIGEYLFLPDIKLKLVKERKKLSKRQFPEPWVEKFADIRAYSQPIYIYYENTLTDTVLCVSVDGNKYLIPFPKTRDILEINKWQYKIGQIINDSEYFDEALQHAGILIKE